MEHLKEAFNILKQHQLFIKKSKYRFAQTSVEYFGHTITRGVQMNNSKVEAILRWPKPTSVKVERVSLGLARYYRRFISNYRLIAAPLTAVLKKNGFNWTTEVDDSLQKLKEALVSASITWFYPSPLLLSVMRYFGHNISLATRGALNCLFKRGVK